MRIYISGPITGTKDFRERFGEAAERIKKMGAEVVNPAELFRVMPEATHEEYLRVCFVMMRSCDAVVFLPGAENSVGAKAELAEAEKLGLPIYYDLAAQQKQYWRLAR